ncbi:MAG: serine/threonine-protein kinase [Polyangiales bacterium]
MAVPGEVVAGRYRIEAEIGQGGFGSVYRATHLALGRQVALKMLHPEVVSHDQGLQRFRREAELAQRLEHPNTVRLYDFGQSEYGLPFIAFELLRGQPLDQAIQRGPMPPARVVRIIGQVLKALMEAHHLGIVHRDIKPGNIFLCEFPGETDYVKVLDFGIAKSTTSHTMLTQAGSTIGTPNYMSPEQVRGETLTPASDLYSVGLMMAEMLSGRMVYGGGGTDVLIEQMSPNPVPLPPQLLSSPLYRVLVGSTQKDPARRYRSAEDMLRDLESVASMPPPAPLPAPAPTYVPLAQINAMNRPPQRSSPLPVILGLVGGLIVMAIVLLMLRPSSSRSDDPRKDPAADDDDDKPHKKKKKHKTSDDDEPAMHKGSLKSKLEKLGWKVLSESTTTQQTMTVTTATGSKGSQTATVMIYEIDNEMTIKSLMTSLSSQKGSAVKRSGNRLTWVMTYPNDASLAEDLLDDLDR